MGALSEVELVDEVDDDRGRDRPHRRWPWIAGSAAAAVLLLVVGQSLLDARERAHLARFDHVTGVLAPLGDHPHVLWSHTGDDAELADAVAVRGRIVVADLSGSSYRIREVARATGHDVWRVTGRVSLPVDSAPDISCRPLGDADDVACVIEPHAVGATRPPAQVLVVDASDGTVESDRSETVEAWTTGGDAIVTGATATHGSQTTWTLAARTASGAPLWHRSLDPVVRPDHPEGAVFTGPALEASGSRVVLMDSGAVWTLDDGRVTSQGEGPADAAVTMEHGVMVRKTWKPTTDNAMEEQPGADLVTLTGRSYHVDGEPVHVDVDDGSADGIVLVQDDGRLTARDTRSGSVAWALPGGMGTPMILGGRVYALVDDPSGLVALDARDGTVRWRQAGTNASGFAQLTTDGRNLYVVDTSSVHPFTLDDGAPLPARAIVSPLDDLLGGSDDDSDDADDINLDTRLGMIVLWTTNDDGARTETVVG